MKALALTLALLAPLSAYGQPYRGTLRDDGTGRFARYTVRPSSLRYDPFTDLLFLTGRFHCRARACPVHGGFFVGVTGTIVDGSFGTRRKECRLATTDIDTFLASSETVPYACTDGRTGEITYPHLR